MSKKDYVERVIAERLIIVHYIWAFNVREIITFIYKFSRHGKHHSKPIIMLRSKHHVLIYKVFIESNTIDRVPMDKLFIENRT